MGDAFAGQTFRQDFLALGIQYSVSEMTKHEIYEAFEPLLAASEVELYGAPKLQEQLLTLVWRGSKIDHQSGDHDDFANAAAGALVLAAGEGNGFIGADPRTVNQNFYRLLAGAGAPDPRTCASAIEYQRHVAYRPMNWGLRFKN
jgi:hypothetical protein